MGSPLLLELDASACCAVIRALNVMVSVEEATADGAPLARGFRAANRGIVVGTAYGVALLLGALYGYACRAGEESILWTLFGGVGFLTGTVAAFGNSPGAVDPDEDPPPGGAVDLSDGAMTAIWVGLVALAANLAWPFAPGQAALMFVGALVGGALLGAVVGEPVLRFLGRVRVKGRQPFLFVASATEGIESEDTRFVIRVLLQTLIFAFLATLAATVIFVFLALMALALAFWLIGLMMDDSSGGRRRVVVPRRGRVREDGRIVRKKFLGEEETGQRIDEQGHVLDERVFGDEATGLKIDPETGQVLKEGFLGDQATGAALKDDGRGGKKVVKQGLLGDQDTGHRLDKDGNAAKAGLLGESDSGFSIDDSGKVTEED